MGDLPHEHYLAQSGYQIDPKPEPSDFSGLRLTARGRTRSARLRRAVSLTPVTWMEPANLAGGLSRPRFMGN